MPTRKPKSIKTSYGKTSYKGTPKSGKSPVKKAVKDTTRLGRENWKQFWKDL